MYIDWTRHIEDPEEKENFKQSVMGSKRTLDRLKDILTEYEKSLDRDESNIAIYDSPNWAYRQAFQNGCRAYIRRIKTLIDLDQQKEYK
jgi:hypothetical protein